MYTYSWYQWITFFYIYCFFGWIFESSYVSFKKHKLINRGFLRIPMLPLYGFGAVMMLWVSLPVRDNLVLVYLSGVITATFLEYVTGSMMEQLFKIRYWDYSSQKFQVRGYICLSSSVAWGCLTILMTEVIHEPIENIVFRLNQNVVLYCVFMVSVVFAADMYISTRTALALGKSLEAITKLEADIEKIQSRLTALREEAAELANEFKCRHQSGELNHLLHQLEEAKAKRQAILHPSGLHQFYRKGLLFGNPGAASFKFAAALRKIYEEIEYHVKRK